MDITNSIVEIITQGAFYKCFSLSEIKIPKNVTQISNFAFFRCQSLLFITLACLDKNGISFFPLLVKNPIMRNEFIS